MKKIEEKGRKRKGESFKESREENSKLQGWPMINSKC
jgi:hypothetical protein